MNEPVFADTLHYSVQLYSTLKWRHLYLELQNHEYTEVTEVEDYLRRAYPAYRRRPQAQFREVVGKAITLVQCKGGPSKPELQLQVTPTSSLRLLARD